jgi:hypothetical protein
MNYSTLFPKVLNKLGNEYNVHFKNDLRFISDSNKTRQNKKHNIYLPHGKKCILWFANIEGQDYSFLIELEKNKPSKVSFKYMCFDKSLSKYTGTLIYGTSIRRNMFCAEKVVLYNNNVMLNKNILHHMNLLKMIIDTRIKQIDHEFFLKVCYPNISEDASFVLYASNLPYRVYQIRKTNNFNENIHHMACNFSVVQINSNRDIYELYLKKGNRLHKYDSAFVNDYKTSLFLKEVFQDRKKKYQDIEYSDDENDNEGTNDDIMTSKSITLSCIYINNVKKWKPYFKSRYPVDNLSKIKEIEKKYNAYIKQ